MPDINDILNNRADLKKAEHSFKGSRSEAAEIFKSTGDTGKDNPEEALPRNVSADDELDKIITEVKSFDDALKVIDNSGLSPAPVTRTSITRSVPYSAAARPVLQYPDTGFDSLLPDNTPAADTTVTHTAPRPAQSASESFWADDIPVEDLTASRPAAQPQTARAMPRRTISDSIAGRRDKPADIIKTYGIKLKKLIGIKDPEVKMPDFSESKIDKGPADFKMKFDFESAYKDPPENRPLRWRRERRTGLIGGLMLAVFILCVGVVLASIMWMATIDVLGFAADDEEIDITVPNDFTMDVITDMLYEAGLIRYKSLFNLFAEYSEAEGKISPGAYVLNKNYDYRALVQGMTARAGIRVETTVTIPEGFTLSRIFKLLEDEEVCTEQELWEAATHHDFNFYFLDKETLGDRRRLEGFLFPDTYNFYKGSTAVQAISKMLRQFDNKFTEQYVERADRLGFTVREIVTIASMIEREAANDEERPRISAVIHNRLNNPSTFPMLEIDATFYYAVEGTTIPPSPQVDSVYNTYMYPGLPPGPIANPGEASLRGALYPDSTNEYFYALHIDGSHSFFRNATDHANFVNSDEFDGG